VLFKNALKIVESRFNACCCFLNSSTNSNKKEIALKKLTSSCDVILELAPGQMFDIKAKSIPRVFFALGFMSNPFNLMASFNRKLMTANSVLFSCKADLEMFNKIFGKTGRSMGYIVPFPLEVNEFKPQSELENKRMRERFGIGGDVFLILYAGRINVQKNIHTLLKIFREAIKRFPQTRLCIAGEEDRGGFEEFGISNNGYTGYIRRKCLEYGIADKVIFTGKLKREDLISLYSSADVFMNCTISQYENFGYSQVEAMACGTPVICSHWGGLKDTVIHGKCGYHMPTILSNNGVKVDWQSGLRQLIGLLEDKDRLKEMSRQAREHAKLNFSFDRFAKMLEFVLLDTMKRNNKNKKHHYLLKIKKENPHFMNLFMEYLYVNRKNYKKGPVCVNSPKSLFFRRNYSHYKSFIKAYSSLSGSEMLKRNGSIPYFLQDVRLMYKGQRLYIQDPLWPARYRLEDWQFRIASVIDGNRSLEDINSNFIHRGFKKRRDSLKRFYKHLAEEGVVSFLSN